MEVKIENSAGARNLSRHFRPISAFRHPPKIPRILCARKKVEIEGLEDYEATARVRNLAQGNGKQKSPSV